MRDYCEDCLGLYKKVTGVTKLKTTSKPFIPDGSLVAADEEVCGQLGSDACSLLMKCLWIARLSRPDISKAIGDMTTKIAKWSKNDDKRLYRLFCFMHTTRNKTMVGYVGDPPDKLFLQLFTDADFAGDSGSSRSTRWRVPGSPRE